MGFQFLKREGKLVFKLVGLGTFLREPRASLCKSSLFKRPFGSTVDGRIITLLPIALFLVNFNIASCILLESLQVEQAENC